MALSICSMLIHFRNMLSVLNTKAFPFSQIEDYAYRNITNSAVNYSWKSYNIMIIPVAFTIF